MTSSRCRVFLTAVAACAAALSGVARGQCVGYTITQTTGTIDPGTADTGNHVDDGLTAITLPFAWTLFGTSYTTANVSSNGNIQFGAPTGSFTAAYTNECLSANPAQVTGPAIFPHWDDLMTNSGGIFTSTTGAAPNRVFNIEWRAGYYPSTTPTLNFEVKLYEGQGRFDMVYGTIPQGGSSATIGVQAASGGPLVQYSCNGGGIAQGTLLRFDCSTSGSPLGSLSVNPATGGIGASFTAQCHVTPGVGPASTGLAVSLNASSVDGGTVVLHDDGVAPDTTAGDNNFSGTVTVGLNASNGARTLIATVSDDQLRSSTCTTTYTVNTVPLSGNGAASPASVFACGATPVLLTVATTAASGPPVSTGIAVTANLSGIGGSSSQVFFNDGTHGDATAGDSTFSFAATVPAATATGSHPLPFTVTDAQGRNFNGSIALQVSPCPTSGPDVYVGGLTDVGYFGNVGGATPTGIYAYAVGTNACNAGDSPVGWYSSNNRHPVIAQAIYRLKNGRFEQLGQSWLKHGFASTNSNFCGTCQQPPDGGAQLGVACSDAYGSGLNGDQGFLGPRSEVNATTGAYPWPHSSPADTSVIGGRVQTHWPDIDPAQNSGARYFAEGHYVTADDATFVNTTPPNNIHGNGLNNATWREINMSNPTATSIPFIGNDHPMQHGLKAWQAIDATVVLANADYMDSSITARFIVGAKVTSNGNGTWTYEYAVANMNSDRAGGTFTVPLPANAVVSSIGFHDVDSHSGEPYSLTDWTSAVTSNGITWTTQTFAQNANANAIRWATMYNFRFTANVAPNNSGTVTVGLFKPATAGSPATSASAIVPAPTVITCGSADFNCDGNLGTDADIESFFTCLAGTCPSGPCTSTADFNADGDVGTDADIEAFFRVLAGGTC